MADKIDTRYFTRLERVTRVTQTNQGILAAVDGELLRVDVIRDDILRLKISRGRVFDEEPTFAVCADLQPTGTMFTVEEDDEVVRLRTDRVVLSVWKAPFRLDAHRADGSMIFETQQDRDGHYGTYATLNDAWVVSRRCRQEDAFFGLGEKGGHFDRKGRDFTLWNTDVLSPRESAEFTAGRAPDDPRSDRTSTEFDPYYVSIPFFYHLAQVDSRMAGFFIDNGYRAEFEFSHPTAYRFKFEGGQYTEYIFGAPTMREILSAYTWLTGRMQLPPLWALGYHQCRWFRYTQAAVRARGAAPRQGDPL